MRPCRRARSCRTGRSARLPPRNTETSAISAKRDDDQREADVGELVREEVARLLDVVDVVQRAARGAEGARGAVQRDRDAEDQRRRDGAAGGLDRLRQQRLERIGDLGRRAVLRRVVDGLGDERLVADQAEQRDPDEQRRKQRHHHVVRQRGRAVAHLVGLELLERPLERLDHVARATFPARGAADEPCRQLSWRAWAAARGRRRPRARARARACWSAARARA